MSQHEQEPQSFHITFNLGSHTFEFDPELSAPKVFKMKEQNHHDYFLYISEYVNGQPTKALVFFRELFSYHDIDFDELIDFFSDENIPIKEQDEPDEADKHLYGAWSKSQKRLPLVVLLANETDDEPTEEPEEIPLDENGNQIAPELTTYGNTKERKIENYTEFIAYLIEHNRGDLL